MFAGGCAGALARLGLVEALPHGPLEWPWPTFIANLLGAFALGYFATRLQERLPLSAYRRPLLGTGFCGALTTFSTMQLEIYDILDGGAVGADRAGLRQERRAVRRERRRTSFSCRASRLDGPVRADDHGLDNLGRDPDELREGGGSVHAGARS